MPVAPVSRINVLTAIRDHDLQGAGPFAAALGFETPSEELLVERGRRYDARAVLAYAHGKATGEYLTPEQVTLASLKILTDHGFSVMFRSEVDRPKVKPKPKPSTRSKAAPAARSSRTRPEPVVKLCPTCFTQLSMAGTCDYCE